MTDAADTLNTFTDLAERGYRATYEPDDGGPYYLIPRPSDVDWKAWSNATRWLLHQVGEYLDLDVIEKNLERDLVRLEHLESRGVLETDLPIEGTDLRSYADRCRQQLEHVRALRAASEVPLDKVRAPA